MTNKEFIMQLMSYPLEAEVSIDCGCCAHGTLYTGNTAPVIKTDGSTYKTLTITTNDRFELEALELKNVGTDDLLGEIKKRSRPVR